jgi:hypothetical protein
LVTKDLGAETVLELGDVDQQNKARDNWNYDDRKAGQ